MITLYTFPGRDGLESVSPFCMKVEVYLKLAKLPYKAKLGNPRVAPKGKLPYIEQPGGPTIADSNAIIAHFERERESPLDAGITEDETARARVIGRTLEEGLYFVVLWTRWIDDAGWAVQRTVIDALLPAAVRWAVSPMIRRSVAGTLRAQGTGRHTREEIFEAGSRDVAALATLLGDRPFFLGERMRTIDVTAYAFLANLMRYELDTPIRATLLAAPNLTAYVDRMAARVADAAAS